MSKIIAASAAADQAVYPELERMHREAVEIIGQMKGVQFDAAIVDLFLRIIAESD